MIGKCFIVFRFVNFLPFVANFLAYHFQAWSLLISFDFVENSLSDLFSSQTLETSYSYDTGEKSLIVPFLNCQRPIKFNWFEQTYLFLNIPAKWRQISWFSTDFLDFFSCFSQFTYLLTMLVSSEFSARNWKIVSSWLLSGSKDSSWVR